MKYYQNQNDDGTAETKVMTDADALADLNSSSLPKNKELVETDCELNETLTCVSKERDDLKSYFELLKETCGWGPNGSSHQSSQNDEFVNYVAKKMKRAYFWEKLCTLAIKKRMAKGRLNQDPPPRPKIKTTGNSGRKFLHSC